MTHAIKTHDGHDCIDEPCRHDPPPRERGGHGRHGDQWWYVVADDDGQAATVLQVGTMLLRGECPARPGWDDPVLRARYPRGSDVCLHVAFPTTEGQLRGAEPPDKDACEFLGGRPCYVQYASGLAAGALYAPHRAPMTEPGQTEAFWKDLDAHHRKLRVRAEAERDALTLERCAACGGRGLVPR